MSMQLLTLTISQKDHMSTFCVPDTSLLKHAIICYLLNITLSYHYEAALFQKKKLPVYHNKKEKETMKCLRNHIIPKKYDTDFIR